MHLCPEEIAALAAFLAAGPLLVFRYARHKADCFCRWCGRVIFRK